MSLFFYIKEVMWSDVCFDSPYRFNMKSPLEGLCLEMNEDGLN